MPYTPPKYPSEIPTQTGDTPDLPDRVDDLDWLYAARYNELKKELLACLTELGVLPKGSYADVAARLAALIDIASPVDGDIIIRSGDAWVRLPKGDNGQFLSLVDGLPAWVAAPGGFTFRTGDLLFSLNLTPPSGWSDISTTYNDYFIRISNAGELGTGGSNTHSHSLIEANLASHSHGVGSLVAEAEAAHTHGVGTIAAANEEAHTHAIGTLAVGSEAAHTHGAGSYAVGNEAAHTHAAGTLAVGNEAAHTHAAGSYAAASGGAHTHNYDRLPYDNFLCQAEQAYSAVTLDVVSTATSSAGAHGHSISGSSAAGSSHTHSLSGSTAAGSSHTHSFSGTSGAGSSHTHDLTGAPGAGTAHTHTLSGSTAAGSSHTHTLSGATAAVGSGTSFSGDNVPVWLGVRCYQKD